MELRVALKSFERELRVELDDMVSKRKRGTVEALGM